MKKEKNNQLIGKRIKECLTLRNMKQADLLRILDKKNSTVSKQNLSGTINRGTPLADDKIITIAEILDIYPDYLLGAHPLCESYAEYKELNKLENDPNFRKYKKKLDQTNLFLSSSMSDNSLSLEYTITDTVTNMRKEFSINDIELFYSRIIEAIRGLFNDYRDKFPDDFSDPEEWIKYFSWHPDEFSDDAKKQIIAIHASNKKGSDPLD